MTVRHLPARHPPILAAGTRWAWPLGLVAVLATVAAVYAPTVNDFFGGDDFLVIGPVHNMGPWELIWKSVILRDNIPYWRPLVSPIYALEVHGFWLRPWAYHLTALGLHLANVALLALVAAALTGRRGVALAAALLFGVHAAHTTTVAQISSTVELLSVVWYFTAVWCAVKYVRPIPPDPPSLQGREEHGARSGTLPALPFRAVRGVRAERGGGARISRQGWRGRSRWYLLSVAAFALALLSKESTASAAGVITVLCFLYVFLPERRLRRFLLDVLPFWALVIPYIAFTYLTDTDDPTGIITHMYFLGGHVGQNMWWFLARLAVPLRAGHGPDVSVVGHAGAALLLAGGALVLLRGPREGRLLVLWTGIALTPLALWRPELLLGRFTYQASAPFAILLALGGAWMVGRLRLRARTPAGVGMAAAPAWLVGGVLVLAAAALLGGLTVTQNRERTREGEDYRVLVMALRRELPALPPGSEVKLLDGIWTGPFHRLYLEAVADTLYGAGNVKLVNVDPGDAPAAVDGVTIRLRYRDGRLVRVEPAR